MVGTRNPRALVLPDKREWCCWVCPYLRAQALGSIGDLLEGRSAIQRDLDGLEKMTDRHLVRFKDEEREVLHLGQNNPVQQGRQGLNGQGAALEQRTWGSWGQPGSQQVS